MRTVRLGDTWARTARSHGCKLLQYHKHDWFMILGLVVIEIVLNVINPFYRFVGKDMMTDLKYPMKANTVPFWAVPIYAIILPILIFSIHYIRKKDLNDLHHAILGLLFAVLITAVITDSIKDAVGRPRPDFYWRCFPDGVPNYDNVTEDVICHGDPKVIKEGHKSFPSGHTSWSFAGLGYVSLYLAAKINIFDRQGHAAKLCIVFFPLLAAALVGVSRVDDYWHHWQDVFAGGLLGLTMATLCYRQFFPAPYDSDGIQIMIPRNISCFLKLVINEGTTFGYLKKCYSTTRTLNRKQKREKLKPWKVSPIQSVPSHIIRPSYVGSNSTPLVGKDPEIHDATGVHYMRDASRLAASALEYAGTFVKPGTTTDEIDKAVHKMIISAGAYPSPLGYKGFPKSICTSVNECAFHGIPDFRPLEDGDIINIDVTVFLNGYHADTSKTFLCGNVDDIASQLVKVTEECLLRAIAVCGPGVEIKELGKEVIGHAGRYGYGVDKSYCGHGVGKHFHSAPVIHFYDDQPGCMMVGQTFALEPLLTLGDTDYERWDDNWTVVTADGSLSAQFEHTLLITESGVEVLTQQT